jgi:EAL domain-containing protein (putative c-di-GMP-specific phosphodiesterase class I)
MVKKKETLKDLSEFMKNQPKEMTQDQHFLDRKPTNLARVEKLKSEVDKLQHLPANSLHEKEIVSLIQTIAENAGLSSRQVLFSIAEKLMEEEKEKDYIDILFENNISFLKYHQLLIDKLNT